MEVGSTNILEIPDEILLNVFQYLSYKDLGRCCMTCQKFRQIASDKSFWEVISINQEDPTDFVTVPTSFIEQALRLDTAYLNLNNIVLLGPSHFTKIENKLKYLSVKCADPKILGNKLNGITQKESEQRFDVILEDLLLSTSNLEKLSIDWMTPKIIEGILQNSKSLKVLSLSQGLKGYYHSIQLPENIGKIATECRELKEFSLSLYEVDEEEFHMGYFCRNITPNLKKIGLNFVGDFRKEMLHQLVSRCNKLLALSLHESDIADEGMDMIIEHLSETLEELDVGSVSLNKISNLSKLKKFWIQDNPFLDPEMNLIAELASLNEQMPHLQINKANLIQLWRLTDELKLVNKKGILCHTDRKWILPNEGLIPSGNEIKDEVTGEFFKFNDDYKAEFVAKKFGRGYLGFGHYGATHGSNGLKEDLILKAGSL